MTHFPTPPLPHSLRKWSLPIGIWLSLSTPALAQVTPDRTLPNPSIVTPSGTTVVITGGTRADTNLFHSFRQFSIPAGQTAYFDNASDVAHIISRVTGTDPSRINGRLRANGNTTVFLINPQGIVFGPNASLDIGGSFIASTANALTFADGRQFSATEPDATTLLTVSMPVGLQVGANAGAIVNRSVAPLLDGAGNPVLTEDGLPLQGGLQVRSGQTLALIGGAIALPRGALTAEGGRLELGSVQEGSVGLRPANTGWIFDYMGVSAFRDITLSEAAVVGANDGGTGSTIRVHGETVSLSGFSGLYSITTDDQPGGDIRIWADRLRLEDARILSLTLGNGASGDVAIATRQLIAQSSGQVSVETDAAGPTGKLTVRASERIDLRGGFFDAFTEQWFPSGLLTQVGENGTGAGGALTLTTPTLRLVDGAQVSTATFGQGNAGPLRVQADRVDIIGSAQDGDELATANGLPFGSGLFTSATEFSTGHGGDLVISARSLSLQQGGAVQTATFGPGDAGDLMIQATERIEVIGTDRAGLFPTSINAASGGITGVIGGGFRTATGRGGTLTLTTPTLHVLEGGAIAVGSLNPSEATQGAGQLRITTDTLQLDQQSRLLTETTGGNGGDLRLRAQTIVLRRNSLISTSAGVENRGGDGGNIIIDTRFLVAVPTEDSDIRANAFTGAGGNVTITADSIIGIAPRSAPTPLSDITASSQFGVSGVIQLNTPDIDPSRGLVELPTALDAPDQITRSCAAGGTIADSTPQNEFVITGRGGVPPGPSQPQPTLTSMSPWAELTPPEHLSAAGEPAPPTPATTLVEAHQWIRQADGAIALVAALPSVDPTGWPHPPQPAPPISHSASRLAGCHR